MAPRNQTTTTPQQSRPVFIPRRLRPAAQTPPPPPQQSRIVFFRRLRDSAPPPPVVRQRQLSAAVTYSLRMLDEAETNARLENMLFDDHYGKTHNDGLSEEIIVKNMKTRTVIKPDDDDDDDKEVCVVCQDYLFDREKEINIAAILDNCRHKFHAECMKKWLTEKNMCPLCKAVGLNVDQDR